MTTDIPVSVPASANPAPAPAAPAAPEPPAVAPSPAAASGGEGNAPSGNAPAEPAAVTPAAPPAGSETPAAPSPAPAAETPPAAPAPEPATPPSPSFKVPDEFKDKPWAAKVTSEAELWKALAGAQELIGKKSIVPDLKTATPEDREAFYKQLRPADVSEYTFSGDMANPDVRAAVGKMFMENGISAVQGNAIIDNYQKLGEQVQAQMFDPAGFTEAMKGTFGEGWEGVRDGIHKNLQGLMTADDYKLMEGKLPNAYVNLIYRTLGNTQKAVENMMQRYGVKETTLAHFADPSSTAGGGDINVTRANIRAEIGRLTAGPHTVDQLQTLRGKLTETYKNDPRIQKEG